MQIEIPEGSVKKTEATFFGRKVIQVDEIFFVDNGFAADPEQADCFITDSKQTVVHQGRLYTRVDLTPEMQAARLATKEILDALPVADVVIPV